MQLSEKFALIPGACQPVGRAIAKKFGTAGATLILPVFDWPESITEMENEFTDNGYKFYIIPADLREKEDINHLTEVIRKRSGCIDYLINNIERGGMPVVHGSYEYSHNHEQWDIEFNTTLKAKWLLYTHCKPLIKGREGASIVNISSISAVTGRSGPAAAFFSDGYSAANRAIGSFTETWARELAPTVRVNEVMLGLVRHRHGEGTRGWGVLSESEKKSLKAAILLNRTASPEEVADSIFFLAVEATYCTGTTLTMDGGFTLGGATVPLMPPGILE